MTTSKVKFDVTGTLSGSEVAVGCQRFGLAAAVEAADKVEIEGTTVRATGVTVDVVEGTDDYRIVTLPNGRRMYVADLRTHVTNLTDATPPAPVWVDGDVCVGHGGFTPARTGTTAEIRVRERKNGQWVRTEQGTRPLMDKWSDAEMDRNIANGGYKPVRRGGDDDKGLAPGARVRVGDPAGTRADGSGYVSADAYGKTGTVQRKSSANAGCWIITGDTGWSQVIHQNSLTVI